MYKKYGNKFMCFSPPVMLATFLIEFGLLFYVLWRYQLTTLTRLITVFIACLGTFQLSEYMLCGGLGLGHIEWVKLGFISITLLPVLGLHITATIAKVSVRPLLYVAYTSAAAFVAYFALIGGADIIRECAPNYAILQLGETASFVYGAYYYGWLLATIGLASLWARQKPKKATILRWMVAGYAVFIIPTSLANLIDPSTILAIPSIMCGFAVLCAIVLVWQVLPLSKNPLRQKVKSLKKRA